MMLAPNVTLSLTGAASYLKMTTSTATTTANESFPLPLYLCADSMVITLIARRMKSLSCLLDCCRY